MGRPFAASLKFNADFRAEFDFGQGLDGADGEEAPDFSGQESLGPCPKCNANVYEHGSGYICEKATGPARTCDFRSGKIILQQEIPREQMVKLLTTGKTDLFTKFISKKNRPFKAFLVKKPDGNVGFEFLERKAAKAPAKKVAAVEEEPAEYAVAKAPAKKAAAKNAANDPAAPVKAVAKKAAKGTAKTVAKAPAKSTAKAPAKKAVKKAVVRKAA
jgi:DNA topoisomerase-3